MWESNWVNSCSLLGIGLQKPENIFQVHIFFVWFILVSNTNFIYYLFLCTDLELVCGILRRVIDPVVLLNDTTSDLTVQRAFGAFLAIQATLSQTHLSSFLAFFEVLAKFQVIILHLFRLLNILILNQRNATYMLDAFRGIDVSLLSGSLSTLFVK